jgi:hypothetical protein
VSNPAKKPALHFISGDTLGEWMESGAAEMVGGVLSFRVGRQYVSSMSPAVYFKRCVSSAADPRGMAGKVFESWSLGSMGAAFPGRGSAVIDGVAYEVEEGFLLTESITRTQAGKKTQERSERPSQEVDMLASLVLTGMRSAKDGKG